MKYIKSDNSTHHKLYNIEKIITRKIFKGKKLYLIKWEGYSLNNCTWEPLFHLKTVYDMVIEFEEAYPSSILRKEYKQFLRLYKNYKLQNKFNKNTIISSSNQEEPKENKQN